MFRIPIGTKVVFGIGIVLTCIVNLEWMYSSFQNSPNDFIERLAVVHTSPDKSLDWIHFPSEILDLTPFRSSHEYSTEPLAWFFWIALNYNRLPNYIVFLIRTNTNIMGFFFNMFNTDQTNNEPNTLYF